MKTIISKAGLLFVAVLLAIQACTPASDVLGNLAATQTAIALVNTWHVRQGAGNDTNDCLSEATACETIQGAMAKSRLFHNPTILLHLGGYYEFPDVSSESGWREIDRDVTIISDHGRDSTEFLGTEGIPLWIVNNAHVVLDGIWIRSSVLVDTGSSLTLRNAKVSGGQGPGINHMGDELIIEDSEISHNLGGGVVVSSGTGTISGTIIDNNDGAGITNQGVLSVAETWIYENHFYDDGQGVVRSTAGIENNGQAVVERSVIFNNHGIYAISNNTPGSMTLINSTVSGNDITASGGAAIYNRGSFDLIYSTVAANHGLGILRSSGSDSMLFKNSLIANNNGGNCNFSGALPTLEGTNLDTDRSCFPDADADILKVANFLGPLSETSGSTLTHALLPRNPAINAATGDCPDTDQRGESRPAPAGSACDVGAFEAPQLEIFELPATDAPGDQIDIPPLAPMSATAIQNANCRYGPSTAYDIADTLFAGQTALILGRNEAKTWWQIQGPTFGSLCWVSYVTVKVSGDVETLPIAVAPPLPDASPDKPPAAPQGCFVYDQYQNVVCTVPCPLDPQPGGACTP